MRKEQFIKIAVTIIGIVLFLSVKVHADPRVGGYNIKIKQPKPAATYEVCDKHGDNCKEQNAAEATVAKLQDDTKRVFKITKTEVEMVQGAKGLELDKK